MRIYNRARHHGNLITRYYPHLGQVPSSPEIQYALANSVPLASIDDVNNSITRLAVKTDGSEIVKLGAAFAGTNKYTLLAANGEWRVAVLPLEGAAPGVVRLIPLGDIISGYRVIANDDVQRQLYAMITLPTTFDSPVTLETFFKVVGDTYNFAYAALNEITRVGGTEAGAKRFLELPNAGALAFLQAANIQLRILWGIGQVSGREYDQLQNDMVVNGAAAAVNEASDALSRSQSAIFSAIDTVSALAKGVAGQMTKWFSGRWQKITNLYGSLARFNREQDQLIKASEGSTSPEALSILKKGLLASMLVQQKFELQIQQLGISVAKLRQDSGALGNLGLVDPVSAGTIAIFGIAIPTVIVATVVSTIFATLIFLIGGDIWNGTRPGWMKSAKYKIDEQVEAMKLQDQANKEYQKKYGKPSEPTVTSKQQEQERMRDILNSLKGLQSTKQLLKSVQDNSNDPGMFSVRIDQLESDQKTIANDSEKIFGKKFPITGEEETSLMPYILGGGALFALGIYLYYKNKE